MINYYTVLSDVQENGWQLLSEEYKNLKTEMRFQCPKGHVITSTYDNWRRNHLCVECAKQANGNVLRNEFISRPAAVNQRVLSLDAATGTSGWSVFDDGKLVCYGNFSTDINDPMPARINQVKNWVIDAIEQLKPDCVGIENIQMQENVKTFQVLANLQGVLIDLLFENNINYYLATSSEWRSYLGLNHGDKRSTAKQAAQQWANMTFHIKPTQDEADAICMGMFFSKHFKQATRRSYATWGEEIE